MTILVGLGNPGGKYEGTRHNIGFQIVDSLAKELGTHAVNFSSKDSLFSHIAVVGGVVLMKPQTYMNESGKAVKAVMTYYASTPEDVWIIHDDIDLPLGKIRIRQKGGSGGHKGVISILDTLHSDACVRFRLGIGRGHESGEEDEKNLHRRSVISHVLSRFRRSEAGSMKHLIEKGSDAVRLALLSGLETAMNRYN